MIKKLTKDLDDQIVKKNKKDIKTETAYAGTKEMTFDSWTMSKDRKKELKEIFDMCDGNDDGVLSLREIQKSVTNNQEIANMLRIPVKYSKNYAAYLEEVFQVMDSDESGTVDREEFISYFTIHDCQQVIVA